eukprot:30065-Pelagococcus_subviridis.AAC.2
MKDRRTARHRVHTVRVQHEEHYKLTNDERRASRVLVRLRPRAKRSSLARRVTASSYRTPRASRAPRSYAGSGSSAGRCTAPATRARPPL